MINSDILRSEERAIFALRSLYGKYGYLPYKMSKFEEYEFYINNKDFLVSDRIIAFNDTSGKLLALKPDVTLSIVKNAELAEGFKNKVCYNENVYRVSENTHQFKEIMQTGVECIGDIGLYDIYEVVLLAALSLESLAEDFVLEVSHLGILSSLLENICGDSEFSQKAIKYISQKNSHDLAALCDQFEIEPKKSVMLCEFASLYGQRDYVLSKLEEIKDFISADALGELKNLSAMLKSLSCSEKIVFDFSAVNDMNYYNGIVFKGFLSGISQSVLAGGQYDKLLLKMNKKAGAIGFAIYLDLLEELSSSERGYDVDVLVICDASTDYALLTKKVNEIINGGQSVSVQSTNTEKISYKEILDLRGGEDA